MEKRLENKRGITLIALVVTIIILIILAGISINLVLGDNGILKRARYAKDREAIVGLREEAEMVLAKREMDRIDGDTIALKEDLEQGIQGDKIVEEATVGDTIYLDTCYVTRSGHTITVYEDGTAEEGRIEIWDGSSKTKPEIDENRNWHIYTASEMKYFADFVNGYLTEEEKGDLTIEDTVTIVYLENNLDLGARQADGVLQKGTEWEPIGGHYATGLYFNATFEGNGHSIKGVYINSEEEKDHVGLFGSARIVQNLTIKDSYIKGIGTDDEDAWAVVGGIVGENMRIINCHNVNTEVSGVKYVGGVAGWSRLIEDCSNTGNISGEEYCIGGISGDADEIKRCYNSGKVTGKEDVGGIAGGGSKISECENTGTVTGNNVVGGISGFVYKDGIVSKCLNKGKVIGNADFIGGILGFCRGTLEKSYNEGEVIGTGTAIEEKGGSETRCEGLGGVCGETGNNTTVIVRNCYNRGNVIVESPNFMGVGGVIGYVSTGGASGEIHNNYNIGQIVVKGNDVIRVGGAIGRIDTDQYERRNNYYIEGTTRTEENKEGESRTKEQMKTQQFVNELNEGLEESVWIIENHKNEGYPILKDF